MKEVSLLKRKSGCFQTDAHNHPVISRDQMHARSSTEDQAFSPVSGSPFRASYEDGPGCPAICTMQDRSMAASTLPPSLSTKSSLTNMNSIRLCSMIKLLTSSLQNSRIRAVLFHRGSQLSCMHPTFHLGVWISQRPLMAKKYATPSRCFLNVI